jgi:hypothetical protein
MRSAWTVLALGLAGLGVLATIGVRAAEAHALTTGHSGDVRGLVVLSGYALSLHVFVVGLGAYLRARISTPLTARVLLFALLFALSVGPWVVAAIAGLLGDRSADRAVLAVAAPSPFYIFVVLDALDHVGRDIHVIAGAAAVTGWASLGVVLLVAARDRCAAIIRRHEAMLAEGDRLRAAEDVAAARATRDTEDVAPPGSAQGA